MANDYDDVNYPPRALIPLVIITMIKTCFADVGLLMEARTARRDEKKK
jgi:hypothetical protein